MYMTVKVLVNMKKTYISSTMKIPLQITSLIFFPSKKTTTKIQKIPENNPTPKKSDSAQKWLFLRSCVSTDTKLISILISDSIRMDTMKVTALFCQSHLHGLPHSEMFVLMAAFYQRKLAPIFTSQHKMKFTINLFWRIQFYNYNLQVHKAKV